MKIHIYKIYFPTSNKCYIGQTAFLEKRMSQHLGNEYLIGRALRKYDDWQVSILHTCKTRDEANRIEIEEIRNFNCVASNGYNLTAGGDGFFGKHTEATKLKMSNAAKGRRFSEKTKEKLSEAMQGRKNAQGYVHLKEQNENQSNAMQGDKNPMKCPEVAVKISKAMQGDKNPMKNPVTNLKRQISFIKNQLARLENGKNK